MNGGKRKISVLLVCLGNICRSPMAEGALRHHARRLGLDIEIDSAGTGDWHIGHPPDPRAQDAALRFGGIDISELRARQVTVADFRCFDHIVAMDPANLRDLKAIAPPDATARLSLLMDCVAGEEGCAVPDPYYGDAADFEACWQQVDRAAEAFLRNL